MTTHNYYYYGFSRLLSFFVCEKKSWACDIRWIITKKLTTLFAISEPTTPKHRGIRKWKKKLSPLAKKTHMNHATAANYLCCKYIKLWKSSYYGTTATAVVAAAAAARANNFSFYLTDDEMKLYTNLMMTTKELILLHNYALQIPPNYTSVRHFYPIKNMTTYNMICENAQAKFLFRFFLFGPISSFRT